MTCGTCNGTGKVYDRIRVAGEAFDADQYEAECHECGGTGEGGDALIAGILAWKRDPLADKLENELRFLMGRAA